MWNAGLDQRQAAFVAAICADPHDTGLRLVMADWLEEHDDPRGEFIRVQVELVTIPPQPQCDCRDDFVPHQDDCPSHVWVLNHYSRHEALRLRERELLITASKKWVAPVASALGLTFFCGDHGHSGGVGCKWDWRRGFIESVEMSCNLWQQHGPAIVQAAPVLEVCLTDRPSSPREYGGGDDRWVLDRASFAAGLWDVVCDGHGAEFSFAEWWRQEEVAPALSLACVRWARAKAGLPALKEKADA